MILVNLSYHIQIISITKMSKKGFLKNPTNQINLAVFFSYDVNHNINGLIVFM